MNGFRAIADASHVIAVLVLTFKICFTKSSAAGISWKSQFLYAATYCFRYADIFTIFISTYNTSMKILFILTSVGPLLLIPWIFRKDYQKKFDSFWIELLILPVTALAIVVKHDNSILEISWTWSIYMEAVAMIPQLYMIWKGGHIDAYIITYVMAMFSYRGLYIMNWVYRYYTESYYDMIAICGGITETIIGFCGLIMTIYLYRTRVQPSATYFAVHLPANIYTLPFVTSNEKGFKKLGGGVPISPPGDTESLLKMLEEDPSSIGPYNHDLSVPIHKGTFIA